MADSIREQIVQALITLLGGITTTNSYETNIGNNVDRGVRGMLEDSDLPAIVITEGVETVSAGPISKNTCFLDIGIYAYTTYDDGDSWWQSANKMIADIVKRVGTDTTLGGLAIDIQPGERSVGDAETETDVISAVVQITIQYRTGHFDPYN